MKTIQAHRWHLLFFILAIAFLFDAVFLNFFVPWNKTRRPLHHDKANSMLAPETHLVTQDIRSRTNFQTDSKLSYIPNRKRSPSEEPSIPHIIHQTWDTENIPKMYHKWIKTWHAHNPDWEYRLWTLEEIRSFVSKEYPDFIHLYDVYTSDIFRFDMMRYLVLYKFGGIYLDLDMECLKPLVNWTYGYQCILSEETYAHPFVVREVEPPGNIVNGFIATRPGHPFLKFVIDSLSDFAGSYFGDYLHATGPFFLNSVLQSYIENNNGVLNDVMILPPKYFFPTFDPNESDLISNRCFPGKKDLLDKAGRMTCDELNKVFLQRTPDAMSFTDHHWVHAYLLLDDWKLKDTKPIRELVPKAITKQ